MFLFTAEYRNYDIVPDKEPFIDTPVFAIAGCGFTILVTNTPLAAL